MKRWKVVAGLVSVIGLGAVVGANQSVPALTAEQIVPALSAPQRAVDKVPDKVTGLLTEMGADRAKTRFIGETARAKYYAVPSGDKEMCIQVVGEENLVGCTPTQGMASNGLRITTADKSESVWLVGVESLPSKLEEELKAQGAAQTDSVTSASVWKEQSPHFYVKTTNGANK